MSKINPTLRPASKFGEERLAGGEGALSAKQDYSGQLRRVVLANLLWEDIAYCDGEKVADTIRQLVPLVSAEEVYSLALEARTLQKLRHIPLFLAVQMCRYPGHSLLVKDLLPKIITRADMLTDFLAIYLRENGNKASLSHQAKKGLAEAFHNFNAYKFAKYDRNAAIKLRDVMFLVHPKPRDREEARLFKMVAERTLPVPETWETMLSAGKDRKETWTYLINEGKIGGLAFLRNLRNMMKAGVDRKVIEYGFDALNSTMLLPMNFLQAARMNPEFRREIERVMLRAYSGLPKLPGRTLFIIDASGSMVAHLSSRSLLTRYDAACAMAMLAVSQCEDCEIAVTAGDDWRRIHSTQYLRYLAEGFDLIGQIDAVKMGMQAGGIFTRQCLEWCRKNIEGEFDRIIVFSDSQDCDYPDRIMPEPFGRYNYICDVSAERYGINYRGVWTAEISGFSEHFLTFIAAYEGIENTFEE